MRTVPGVIAALAAASLVVNAQTTVIDTTSYAGQDRGNFSPNNTGQTFTTGVLGPDIYLSSISLKEPRDYPGTTPSIGDTITLELWTDTDGNHATWDPGTLLGTSQNSVLFDTPDRINPFNFSGISLSDNTVYTIRVLTDDASGDSFIRFGVARVATGVNYADGTLFSGGVAPFSNGWDASFAVVTAVPEPSAFALAGLGIASLLVLRRRNG
jgi:hypothetical protein